MPGPARNMMKQNSRAYRGSTYKPGLIALPAEGCTLPVPPMPKEKKWSPEQRKLWKSLWTSPQATQWDSALIPSVAAYVVYTTAVYEGTVTAWSAAEQRHLANQLGLTPQAMSTLGWYIRED